MNLSLPTRFLLVLVLISVFGSGRYLLIKIDGIDGNQSSKFPPPKRGSPLFSRAHTQVNFERPKDCFTGDSLVTMDNGARKKMSDVKVGDSVLAVDNHNNLIYSPIIMQLHQAQKEKAMFIVLRTSTGQSLTVSPQHLVYTIKRKERKDEAKGKENINAFRTVFAANVERGDLLMMHGKNYKLESDMVVDVEEVELTGLYSPLTSQGNIIVDNILASCYSDFESHELQHLAFLPVRWLYAFSEIIAPMKNDDTANGAISQDDEGVFWYGQGLHVFADAFLPWKTWGGHTLN